MLVQMTQIVQKVFVHGNDVGIGGERVLTFYGGVPQLIIPDNPRALVSKANRDEPVLIHTVQDFARHYGCTVLPGPRAPTTRRSSPRSSLACYWSKAGYWHAFVNSSSPASMRSPYKIKKKIRRNRENQKKSGVGGVIAYGYRLKSGLNWDKWSKFNRSEHRNFLRSYFAKSHFGYSYIESPRASVPPTFILREQEP